MTVRVGLNATSCRLKPEMVVLTISPWVANLLLSQITLPFISIPTPHPSPTKSCFSITPHKKIFLKVVNCSAYSQGDFTVVDIQYTA